MILIKPDNNKIIPQTTLDETVTIVNVQDQKFVNHLDKEEVLQQQGGTEKSGRGLTAVSETGIGKGFRSPRRIRDDGVRTEKGTNDLHPAAKKTVWTRTRIVSAVGTFWNEMLIATVMLVMVGRSLTSGILAI